jgi:hypothetical protein
MERKKYILNGKRFLRNKYYKNNNEQVNNTTEEFMELLNNDVQKSKANNLNNYQQNIGQSNPYANMEHVDKNIFNESLNVLNKHPLNTKTFSTNNFNKSLNNKNIESNKLENLHKNINFNNLSKEPKEHKEINNILSIQNLSKINTIPTYN